ncbi:hypothetical protein [Pararhizobium sp. A13]|uniref:hypothetical protein n=1 Tax=Pararhizobium sp. A13 TaxID=3133975 RepID=UPI0032504799
MATSERTKLNSIITALRFFNQFDTKMQVSTMLTLLEIAAAGLDKRSIAVQDLEQKIGMLSGTASRNALYWAEGHNDMRGGHKMVDISIDPNDRRKRSLKLTSKGRAFIDSITGGSHGAEARDEISS